MQLGGIVVGTCPVVVHYLAGLQSVHGFRCYDNVAANAKCQRALAILRKTEVKRRLQGCNPLFAVVIV